MPTTATTPADRQAWPVLEPGVQSKLDLLADVIDVLRGAQHYVQRSGNAHDATGAERIRQAVLMLGGKP